MSDKKAQFIVNYIVAGMLVFGVDFMFGTDSVIRLLAFMWFLNFFTDITRNEVTKP